MDWKEATFRAVVTAGTLTLLGLFYRYMADTGRAWVIPAGILVTLLWALSIDLAHAHTLRRRRTRQETAPGSRQGSTD